MMGSHNVDASGAPLVVGRCSRETGRQRYRLAKSTTIPYESTGSAFEPFDPPTEDSDVDGDDDIDDEPMFVLDDVELGVTNQQGAAGQPNLLGLPTAQEAGAALAHAEQILAQPEPESVAQIDNVDIVWDEDVPSSDEDDQVDDDGGSDGSDWTREGFPHVSTWRLNLTALSQVYSIYFVAYRDGIHVSRPRSCITNQLPEVPDLVLNPPPSQAARRCRGDIDPSRPHQGNQLITALLGSEEVLLMAYDDGDVIGYYTKHIEDILLRQEHAEDGCRPPPIRPFFHENVGRSAWGLAVHTKSRVIAVGTNGHVVHMFAFALTSADDSDAQVFEEARPPRGSLFHKVVRDQWGQNMVTGNSSLHMVHGDMIGHRAANWEFVLEAGPEASNIPNISFSSGPDGQQDRLFAVDVVGTLWVFDVRIPLGRGDPVWFIKNIHDTYAPQLGRSPRGWGVIALDESCFMPQSIDCQDLLGIEAQRINYASSDRSHFIDTSASIESVKNNSTSHPWVRLSKLDNFLFVPRDLGADGGRKSRWAKGLRPHWIYPMSDGHTSLLNKKPGLVPQHLARPNRVLADISILRTYETDMELRNLGAPPYNTAPPDFTGTMCEKVVYQEKPDRARLPRFISDHDRLANLLHIPELHLVVAACMSGRVALVTLTRPKVKSYVVDRGMKVEAILPTKSEEEKDLRPMCPLYGVAASPVPMVSGGGGGGGGDPVRRERRNTTTGIGYDPAKEGPRYRLMLHYYDLTVLSYEISRQSGSDLLLAIL